MKISLAKLDRKAAANPDYVAALKAVGVVRGEWLMVPAASLLAVLDRYDPQRAKALRGAPCKRQEPSLPSMGRRLVNVTKAIGRSVARVAAGRPVLVSDEVQAERQAICESNKCGAYRASDKTCSVCGCGCRGKVLNKTRYAAERCPKQPPLWSESKLDEPSQTG